MALKKDYVYIIKHINERLLEDKEFRDNFENTEAVLVSTKIFNNAYSRIEHLSGNKSEIVYTMVTYVNSNSTCELFRKNYSFIPNLEDYNTPNFYVQAYNHAKMQLEFIGSVDC